jgi:hypothetical protein
MHDYVMTLNNINNTLQFYHTFGGITISYRELHYST